jgi:hypothetical protein
MSIVWGRVWVNLRKKKRRMENGLTFEEMAETFDVFSYENARLRFEMVNRARMLEEKRRQGREYTH